MLRIGLIREGKNPPDHRVPLSPEACRRLRAAFPDVEVLVQPSPFRCYRDEEYTAAGIPVQEDLSACDILMGVKEVPIHLLIPGKTYLFFSHTIKKQAHNRKLLAALLDKGIRMIDYEVLTDERGNRVAAFGRYAGIVGAYYGIRTFGHRYSLFDLRAPHQCFDLADMQSEFGKVRLPNIKIAVTGRGRVASGALDILQGMGIRQVSPEEYVSRPFAEPVFVQLSSADYHRRHYDGGFDPAEFYQQPARYESTFERYWKVSDLLIACAYWHPQAPRLFEAQDMQRKDFGMKVIADITCDINGSVPCTVQPSSTAQPVYDFDPLTLEVKEPYSGHHHLSVMAIDNLPTELPRDASESFGQQLLQSALPELLGHQPGTMIERATICEAGRLTAHFAYLHDYVYVS